MHTSEEDSLYLIQGDETAVQQFLESFLQKNEYESSPLLLRESEYLHETTVASQCPCYFTRRSAILTGGIKAELFERVASLIEEAFASCCGGSVETAASQESNSFVVAQPCPERGKRTLRAQACRPVFVAPLPPR